MSSLCATHGPALRRLARALATPGLDEDDCLQEAWVAILGSLDRFDARRGPLTAWMIAVGRNAILDHLRKERRRYRFIYAEGALPDALGLGADPADEACSHELWRRLRSSLRPDEWTLLTHHHLQGLPVAAIAAKEGAAVKTIYGRIAALRRKIEHLVGRDDPADGGKSMEVW